MAEVIVAKKTSFRRNLWNKAKELGTGFTKVLTKVTPMVQNICTFALPILTVATLVATVVGYVQVAVVLAAIKAACAVLLAVGLSAKAARDAITSLGKFVANRILTGKWDYEQLSRDAQRIHDEAANEAKNNVVTRLYVLVACIVLVALFWLLEAHQSGKVPLVLAGVAAGVPALVLVFKHYPPATFVLVACIHVMPPLFWLRNICTRDTVMAHVDSAVIACAVLVYSVALSNHALQLLAALVRAGPIDKSRADSIRRVMRLCMSLFVAYLGATTYWRAARAGAVILLVWQLAELLNSTELVIAATQAAEEWWAQPSTVSASDVFNFIVQHAASLLRAAQTQAIPLWMLGAISCLRIGVASFVVFQIYTTCSTSYYTTLVLAGLAWIFAVCQDAAFVRDVRLGLVDRDPLARLKYCLNML